jgi:putative transposase
MDSEIRVRGKGAAEIPAAPPNRCAEMAVGNYEAGAKVADLARKYAVSEATLYNWKAKFGGMEVSEAKRLKALEEENAKLKKLLADQMLEAAALRELLGKKW